ncbi:uncharacterized protein L3040_003861 [Drepanopeziza brunnea f. sp. 'multigermtubi']|uniref:uncharacterized protein n=1 Tax=Drepanopeziza brunnea f. sp. 'multigermtubi' TaxID=698441 RepID=UPI0023888834|nr:hypothetical protein L3040_003861 [Drepanopeziza brunnea f. sp. 'multigermtubi']
MAFNGSRELLPGRSAPLAIVSASDQGGVVVLAAALGLALALVSILIRVSISRGIRSAADFAAATAMVFSVLQASAVFFSVSHGFGKAIDDIPFSSWVQAEMAIYISEILYLVTLWTTKCSVALLFTLLSPDRGHKIASNAILAVSTLFMIISVLMVAVRCDIAHPYLVSRQACPNLFSRWQAIAGMDITTEICLFSISTSMISSLRLSLKKKAMVDFAFGLRLLIIVPAILHLVSIPAALNSPDSNTKGVLTVTYMQIELSGAIIAATAPCLRPFTRALRAHHRAPASARKSSPGNSGCGMRTWLPPDPDRGKRARGDPRRLTPSERRGREGSSWMQCPATRWDHTEHHAVVVAGHERGCRAAPRSECGRMVIEKESRWAVDFETSEMGGAEKDDGRDRRLSLPL